MIRKFMVLSLICSVATIITGCSIRPLNEKMVYDLSGKKIVTAEDYQKECAAFSKRYKLINSSKVQTIVSNTYIHDYWSGKIHQTDYYISVEYVVPDKNITVKLDIGPDYELYNSVKKGSNIQLYLFEFRDTENNITKYLLSQNNNVRYEEVFSLFNNVQENEKEIMNSR